MASLRRNEARLARFAQSLTRIAANDPTFTRVNFSGWGIGDEGAGRLVEALEGNTVVTGLILSYNGISADLVRALVGVLENNTPLIELDLNRNHFSVEGARALAGLVRNTSSLGVLRLQDCGIGAEGARALAEALLNNSTLRELGLDCNSIGDVGASLLAEVLSGNSTLARLRLGWNGISDAGAREMAVALPHNSSLAEVTMVGNNISDVGARLLAKALLVNCSVAVIYLDENDIIEEHRRHYLEAVYLDESDISEELERLVEELGEINADAFNPQEALGLKIEWLVNLDDDGAQLLDFEEGGAKEMAVSQALDNLDSLVETEQRQEMFGRLLGSSQHGETVANLVDIATAQTMYLDAAQCGAAPGVLMNILRAHESLCSCRDVKHGLYPFMLLAIMPEAGVGDVMELLLMNPDLVKGDMNGAS